MRAFFNIKKIRVGERCRFLGDTRRVWPSLQIITGFVPILEIVSLTITFFILWSCECLQYMSSLLSGQNKKLYIYKQFSFFVRFLFLLLTSPFSQNSNWSVEVITTLSKVSNPADSRQVHWFWFLALPFTNMSNVNNITTDVYLLY